MRIDRQEIPGVGTLHAFTTRAGQRVGVIVRRDGQRTIALYRDDDPDAVQRSVTLNPDEAHHLVDLLSSAVTVEHVDVVPDGTDLARLAVAAGSAAAGRPLGDVVTGETRALALVRDGRVIGWPDAGTELDAGDVLVVAGTPGDVKSLAGLFDPEA